MDRTDSKSLWDAIWGEKREPTNPLEAYLMQGIDMTLDNESPVPQDEFMEYLLELQASAPPYKFPKAEVDNLSDEDLAMEVLDWFSRKITDWDKQYEILISQPKPCQHAYVCKITVDEISNGGYSQLFYNKKAAYGDNMPKVIEIAIEGFGEIGLQQLRDMTKKSLVIYQKNQHLYKDVKPIFALPPEGLLPHQSLRTNVFDELDNMYINCDQNNVFAKIANYIRLHVDCFCD
ncbi:MAG: DMP19 family protein [Defluviitaleaceae bacterium]|nr:DMP19 family protein [Defluviitaleaceae bacterium]